MSLFKLVIFSALPIFFPFSASIATDQCRANLQNSAFANLPELPANVFKDLKAKETMQARKYHPEKIQRTKYELYSAENLKSIGSVAHQILDEFPPSDFFIIGIGGSPSVIIGALQAQSNNYAQTIPLSVPRIHYDTYLSRREIPTETIDDLHAHLDRFLPNPAILKDKSIVVVDYTLSGDSLRVAREAIANYYLAKQLSINIIALALTSNFTINQALFENQITRSIQIYGHLSTLMYEQAFKPISEFNSYIPGITNSSLLVSNPEYLEYVEFFRQHQSTF